MKNNRLLFRANQVYKNVGGTPLLQNINLEIKKGQHTAIIGHNGSGKSSLLKLIAGIYEPTSGIIIRGSQRISYVPEHFPSHLRFKMKEYLMIIGEMSGQSKKKLHDRIKEFADMFFIQDHLEKPLKYCSKGTKQKAGLLQALLTNPDLLLLDEPLSGLDTDSQFELLNHLLLIKKDVTIVFTAHEKVLVDKIAENQLELQNGKLLLPQHASLFSEKMMIKALTQDQETFLKNNRFLKVHWENNHIVTVIVETAEADQVLLEILNGGASIIEVKKVGLENVTVFPISND